LWGLGQLWGLSKVFDAPPSACASRWYRVMCLCNDNGTRYTVELVGPGLLLQGCLPLAHREGTHWCTVDSVQWPPAAVCSQLRLLRV
jgi:hypothetical protein